MRRVLLLSWFVCLSFISSQAQDPCALPHARSLVMSGGGSKGAFEAGAIYHLVVQRGCDFSEISGTSVGALNGALLAQAPVNSDPAISHANFAKEVDALITMWTSIKGTKEIVRGRPLATLRFGLFGLEGMKNFTPLRKLVNDYVSLQRLDTGRELRVGTVTFHDGAYREIVLNANGRTDAKAKDYIFGSAIIPMFGVMPRVAVQNANSEEQVQFSDGSIRHAVPADSYFVQCSWNRTGLLNPADCRNTGNHGIPPHPRVEQLFIILTNPYERDREFKSVYSNAAFKPGTRQMTDGRKIMTRSIDIIMDTVQHMDLDSMLLANDLLAWRAEDISNDPGRKFPVESYNYDAQRPELPGLGYEIAMINPRREDADMSETLNFSPERVATQLYCGCLAADETMRTQFGLESKEAGCKEKFRPAAKSKSAKASAEFPAGVCVNTPAMMEAAKQNAATDENGK
jgi:predicted acylesterase/phospholipase RssA